VSRPSLETPTEATRGAPWPRIIRFGLLACLLSGLYALGALLPFWFLDPPIEGAAFFPAAGLTVSVLLLSPTRRWPWWLLLFGATEIAVDITHDPGWAKAVGFALANTLEPLVGASAVRWAGWRRRESLRERLVIFVLGAVVLGPMVGGFLGASTAYFLGMATSWLTVFGNWWLGDAIGVLVVATPILVWVRRTAWEPVAGYVEIALYVIAGVVLVVVPAVLWHAPMVYAALPLLMVAALRGGMRAVSTAGVGVAFATDWAAVTGRVDSLVAPGSPGQHLVYAQVMLAITLLSAEVLAVEVAERRRIEARARRADAERVEAERVAIDIASSERRRLTRETHDIVGHALSVMLLQAGAARRMLNVEDGLAARERLESLESAGRAAFRELDAVLAVSATAAEDGPGRDIESLADLVEVMRQAGMDVEMSIEGERADVSNIVQWSTYRIVQEALTNVAKHAPRARARVAIAVSATDIRASVVDEGDPRARRDGFRPGRGLIGMDERVTALGGTLEAGPEASGFAVRMVLPLREPLS
jgi:signal transduction histidine kinase